LRGGFKRFCLLYRSLEVTRGDGGPAFEHRQPARGERGMR